MAKYKYPKPTSREVSKRYKRYKKLTKGAKARMTKGEFIRFNYPDYYGANQRCFQSSANWN